MSELPMPSANRLPRARWLDVRLIFGLILILVSIVVGAKFFAEVDERVTVWAVTRDLGANTTLTDEDLVARSVRLDQTARGYVAADQPLAGLVLNRPVGRDELLPAAAVADKAAAGQRRVVVEVQRSSATGLKRGSVVDVYAVRPAKSGEPPLPAELVLAEVTVAEEVHTGSGSFAGTGAKAGVTLFVPAAEVTTMIEAMSRGTVYVVQVPTSVDLRRSARANPR